jgi:FKBP-type peptidyl-prolyl cis-trans isomerase
MNFSEINFAVWTGYGIFAVTLSAILWRVLKRMSVRTSSLAAPPQKPIRSESKKPGLISDILKEGTGPKAAKGNLLTVHYVARLSSGEKVDSSYDRERPMTFKLGARTVIDGWEAALVGVQAGESRRVKVPASLAYGRKGSPSGKVPPHADVIFEIDVLRIE